MDYTAPIVLETATKIAESDEDVQVTLIHDEEPYWNLGYTQKPVEGVAPEVQDHRFCGGEAVLHDNTYCFMTGRESPGSKERIDRDRRDSAEEFISILEETENYDGSFFWEDSTLYNPETEIPGLNISSEADIIYFAPGNGDIYEAEDPSEPNPLTDKQIAGAGFPQIEVELEDELKQVNLARFCVYNEKPSAREIYPENDPHFVSWEEFVDGIRTIDDIGALMQEFHDRFPEPVRDEEFAGRSYNKARKEIDDRQWKLRNGSGRNAGSCF